MPSLVSHAKNQTSAAITEAENRTSEGPFGRQMAYEFGAKWIYEFAPTADFEGHGIYSGMRRAHGASGCRLGFGGGGAGRRWDFNTSRCVQDLEFQNRTPEKPA